MTSLRKRARSDNGAIHRLCEKVRERPPAGISPYGVVTSLRKRARSVAGVILGFDNRTSLR